LRGHRGRRRRTGSMRCDGTIRPGGARPRAGANRDLRNPVTGAPGCRRGARERAGGAAEALANPWILPSSVLPRPGATCMRRLPRAAACQRPTTPGSGGSIGVHASGHRDAITGATLALDRRVELRVPAEPLHGGIAPTGCDNIPSRAAFDRPRRARAGRRPPVPARGPHADGASRADICLFSRFFPSISRHGLYKLGSGGSARPAGGNFARWSCRPRFGCFSRSELDTDA